VLGVIVRGVDIEVRHASASEVNAQLVVSGEEGATASGMHPDESSVREACRGFLRQAEARGILSVAVPALGIAAGMPPVTSGKIMAQEAIRVARAGGSRLQKILYYHAVENGYEDFARTVNGYVKHLVEVLIWGPFVTVDAIIEIPAGLVLVKRRNPPLGFALPGGFVDYGESLEDAVRREAREETGLELTDLRQFHTYSDPARDPRFHTVTTVFAARSTGTPVAGDDAADVRVIAPAEIASLPFAFDHRQVLLEWLAARRS
jgi:8-oxo-dGTP diphosphatase